jgi:hypothetical protein
VERLACHEMIGHTARLIDGRHTSLKCDQCHQVPSEAAMLAEMESIRLPADCGFCHNDPHSGQFAKACQQCHSEHGWTGRWVADAIKVQNLLRLVSRGCPKRASNVTPTLIKARCAPRATRVIRRQDGREAI